MRCKQIALVALAAFAFFAAAAMAETNMTLPLNVSATYCLDANTLRSQQAVLLNDTNSTRVEDMFCQYGCDNVLNVCVPPPIYIVGIFALVLIIIAAVGRRYGKL